MSEKISFIDRSEFAFLDGLEAVEKSVYNKILKMLRNFSQEEGRLIQTQASNSLLLNLRKEILSIIRKSVFIPRVNKFITQFDEVEKRNKSFYSRLLGTSVKTNVSLEKKIIIDHVADSLTKTASINQNFTDPIRKMMVDSVRYKQTFEEAESNLKRLVRGTGKGGLLKRYSSQIVRDSMNGFDGAVNDVIRDAFQLDGWRYVGSLIDDSRLNCENWIEGSGKFKIYSIGDGKYRVADLPAMIRIAKNRDGWNPNTTPETFAQYRGGYRCRHAIYYFRLSTEENQMIQNRLG